MSFDPIDDGTIARLVEETWLVDQGARPAIRAIRKDLDSMFIVYTDSEKHLYEQPLSDLPDSGTLIDPDTGDDMEIIGYTLV